MRRKSQSVSRMIKKHKIHDFATESGKWETRGAEGKTIEATLIRGLFGSVLCLSMQQKEKTWLKF